MVKLKRHLVLVAAGFGGVLIACSEGTGPGNGPTGNERRTPTRLVALGETDFSGLVGTTIEPGPAVRVLDEKNNPVENVPVRFGPSEDKVVLSGPDGVARFGSWQLGTRAGEYFLDARVALTLQQELVVVFHARVNAGPVARFIAIGGNNQVGNPGETLPNQLHAKVSDVFNNPIRGASVSFTVVSGGGSIDLATSTTDYNGVATAGRWKLGMSSPQRVVAKLGPFETLFEAQFCETLRACSLVPENMAFVRDGDIWISSADGPKLVARNGSRPSWSPDGSRLAFFRVSANREEEAICIAAEPFSAASCTPVDRLPFEVSPEMRVSWSPDGRLLALSRVYYGQGNTQLMFLDLATMTIGRHGTIDGSVWSASWSPDGKTLAIASDSRVYLADAGGSGLQVLLPYPVWELAWAPDGQRLGVITLECPWDCYGARIAILDPSTKKLSVIGESEDRGLSGLTWSPDGKSLAYSLWAQATTMMNVRTMNVADGAGNVVLTNASSPSWRRQ